MMISFYLTIRTDRPVALKAFPPGGLCGMSVTKTWINHMDLFTAEDAEKKLYFYSAPSACSAVKTDFNAKRMAAQSLTPQISDINLG
jgi:hypothetical protein